MIAYDLWHIQIPVLEKVLRTVLVYAGLAILLRVAGKRDLAQLNSFDLVVVLLLSNVVQNAVIGNDNSVSGGLLGAAVLIAVNSATVRFFNLHPRLRLIFEGTETVIIRDGHPVIRAIRRIGLRLADVAAAVRRQGADGIHEVEKAVLAPGGSLVVDLFEDDKDVTNRGLRMQREELRAQIRADVRDEIRAALAERG